MTTKHTPGPWRLSETATDSVVCDSDSGHDKPDAVTYYGGHLIAESIFINANRKLLAAAPDLLDVARMVIETYPLMSGAGNSMDLIMAARAAIAKATGAAE